MFNIKFKSYFLKVDKITRKLINSLYLLNGVNYINTNVKKDNFNLITLKILYEENIR